MNWTKIEKLFNTALELPMEERESFLEISCEGQAELKTEVESLLKNAETEDSFLGKPNFSLGLAILGKEKYQSLVGDNIGRYQIVKLLGEGGMGAVYLAKDLPLNRQVALKLLPEYLLEDNESIARFQKEALAASAISHPNIAHIYETGIESKQRFIAMEYVEGKTLRELMQEKKMEVITILDIFWQTANALAAAHQAGIIHRDIKPENIMIRSDGYVKVLDFGIAKLSESQTSALNLNLKSKQRVMQSDRNPQSTTPGLIMGTIGYISPEQLKNKNVDSRTDIWSLGICLYELLAGQKPFNGKTPDEIGKEILGKNYPTVSFPNIDSKNETTLKNILAKMLDKNAAKRYPTANELADELKELKQNLEFSRQLSSGEITNDKFLLNNSGAIEQPQNSTFLSKSQQFWNKQSFSRKALLLAVCIGLLTFVSGVTIQYLARSQENNQSTSVLPKVTHLTQDGRIKDAAISADGHWLAYSPIESEKQSLWVRDLEDGSERQLLPAKLVRLWGMRFLPDGQNLLFITSETDSPVNTLYKISLNGGQPIKIVSNIANPPAISPDGKQIAFIRHHPEKHNDVFLIANLDGSGERETASRQSPDNFVTSSASWSPNGKLIAVGAGRNGGSENAVLAIPVDGGEIIELTPWQWAAFGGVAWENDGHGLIFSAREKGSRTLKIWRLSYPSGEIRNLTSEENAYEEVTLSANENTIVTTRTYEVSDIWSVDSTGTSHRLTTQSNQGADGLTVTPVGKVVYTEGEYEQSFIWNMNTDGSERKQLTKNTGFLPDASRDGRFIAYVSTESGTRHLWLMNADGSNNKKITNGEGENSPSFTSDGNWIIYTVSGKESITLWKMPTEGGQSVQITNEGFTVKPQVSPDGTMIACVYRRKRDDEWKIIVMPITGGEPLKTFNLPNPRSQMIRWTADSSALFYIDKTNGAQNLWQQPLDGKPRQITNFNQDQILHYDTLIDGTKIILSRGGRRRDIAMIKNYK